jgi:hypothetical protein
MVKGQLCQHPLTLARKGQQNFAPVILGPLPAHISSSLQPVYQFHGAVVPDTKSIGEIANPGSHSFGHTLDSQHQLVLPSFEACGLHRFLAESEKLPDLIPEFRQSPIIRQR